MAEEYGKIRKSLLTGIADAIREKKKTTDLLTPVHMADEIRGIESGSLFQSTVTDVIANHIVSATDFAPCGIAEEYIPKKYYYNGVLLPELPAGVLASYPYAWIRKNNTAGYYDLIFSALQPWYSTGEGIRYGTSTGTVTYYQIAISEAETATVWTFNSTRDTWFVLDDSRTVLWSNHDIPNGSVDATEIYFNGSEPVLAE